MADARDKAIAAMQDALRSHYSRGETPWPPRDILAELLDAIPAGVLVDLAIERGALVPAYFNERLYERVPQGGTDG